MALTDLYLVQYLLQATGAHADALCWQDVEHGTYQTDIHGVKVELTECHTRTTTYLCVTFCRGVEKAYIPEPQSVSIFGLRYADESQRRLAEIIRLLAREVGQQCAARRARSPQRDEEIRQEIFRRVVFGPESSAAAD